MGKKRKTRRQQYKKQFRNKTSRRQFGGGGKLGIHSFKVEKIEAWPKVGEVFKTTAIPDPKVAYFDGKVDSKTSSTIGGFFFTTGPGTVVLKGMDYTAAEWEKKKSASTSTSTSASAPWIMKKEIPYDDRGNIKEPMDLKFGVPIKNIDH